MHARCWVRAERPTAARVGPAASADLTGPASAAPQARAHAAVDSGTSLSEQAPPRPVFPRSDACWTSRLGAVNVGGATRSLVLLLYVPRFVFLRQIPSPETRRFFIGPDLLGSLMPPRVRRGSPWVDGRFLWFMYEFALPDGIKCYVRTSFFLDCGFEFPRARDDDTKGQVDGSTFYCRKCSFLHEGWCPPWSGRRSSRFRVPTRAPRDGRSLGARLDDGKIPGFQCRPLSKGAPGRKGTAAHTTQVGSSWCCRATMGGGVDRRGHRGSCAAPGTVGVASGEHC